MGSYDFEFYVDDNTTDEEIQRMIDDELELSQGYEVEEGYIKEQNGNNDLVLFIFCKADNMQ